MINDCWVIDMLSIFVKNTQPCLTSYITEEVPGNLLTEK
jgi:hypothetical protein